MRAHLKHATVLRNAVVSTACRHVKMKASSDQPSRVSSSATANPAIRMSITITIAPNMARTRKL